jgi:hypothetical protein
MEKHTVVFGILFVISLAIIGAAKSSFSPYVDERGKYQSAEGLQGKVSFPW